MKYYKLAQYEKSSTYTKFVVYEDKDLVTIVEVREGNQWLNKTVSTEEARKYAKNILAYKPNPMIPYDRKFKWFNI